jgi:hypothetical protein
MTIANPASLIVRGALQNVSIAYRNLGYVADEVFPIIDGVHKQAKVAKDVKGAWYRDEAQVRAPGGVAPIIEVRITTTNLNPINYAAAAMVTDEERQMAREPGSLPIQPDIDTIELISDKLDLKREIRTAAVIQAASWSAQSAGGVDAEGGWGHGTASSDTFLADIRTGRDTILANTGVLVNSLFLDWPAWSALQVAPALLALMNPRELSADALVTLSALKSLINIENIIIGAAVKNTDEEVIADTFTSQWIWANASAPTKGMGFLYYKPPRAGLKIPSAGYQYRLKKINGQSRLSTTWRENARHSDMYDTEEDVDIAAVGADLGYLWKDTALT